MEGITKRRIEKLKRHLLKVEKETGMPLEDQGSDSSCPLINFAPSETSQGHKLCCTVDGVNYGYLKAGPSTHFLEINLKDRHDVQWWGDLTVVQRAEAYAIIRKWLKERR